MVAVSILGTAIIIANEVAVDVFARVHAKLGDETTEANGYSMYTCKEALPVSLLIGRDSRDSKARCDGKAIESNNTFSHYTSENGVDCISPGAIPEIKCFLPRGAACESPPEMAHTGKTAPPSSGTSTNGEVLPKDPLGFAGAAI